MIYLYSFPCNSEIIRKVTMSKYMAQKGENYIWEILVRKPLEK
jgi:hypothetical protein